MGFRIEVLGGCRLTCHGREVASGHRRLMALLAARAPSPVSRPELVAYLYPEETRAGALNRIRVGLARLRTALPLVETSEGVALGAVAIDVLEVRQHIQSAAESASQPDELRLLGSLLDSLSLPLFPDIADEWAEDERSAWSLESVQTLERIAELASEGSEFSLQLKASQAGLKHLPFDEKLWSYALEAAGRLQLGPEVHKQWEISRRKLRRDGGDYSDDLQELAENLRDPSEAAGASVRFSPAEEELLRRLTARAMLEDPASIRPLLAGSAMSPELMRRPSEGERLLRFLLRNGAGDDLASEGCRVNLVASLAFQENWPAVFEEGESLLKEPMTPNNRRRVLHHLSFGHFFSGNREQAYRYLDEAIAICVSENLEYELWLARCNMAAFQWTNLRFEEAEGLFRECLQYLESVRDRDVVQNIAVVKTNLSSLLAEREKWPEAYELAQAADTLSRGRGHAQNEARAALCAGRALFHLGREEEAVAAVRRGLRRAARFPDVRLQLNCLEFLALGLLGTQWREAGVRWLRTARGLRLGHGFPTDALFGYWYERYLPGDPAPEPRVGAAEILASAFREIRSLTVSAEDSLQPERPPQPIAGEVLSDSHPAPPTGDEA